MSNETTAKTRPTHRIWAITKRTGRKPQWTSIGVAWAHGDGEGFALDYHAYPLEGAEIVLRAITGEGASDLPPV